MFAWRVQIVLTYPYIRLNLIKFFADPKTKEDGLFALGLIRDEDIVLKQ